MNDLTENGYCPKEFSKLIWFNTEKETKDYIRDNQIKGQPFKQFTYYLIVK